MPLLIGKYLCEVKYVEIDMCTVLLRLYHIEFMWILVDSYNIFTFTYILQGSFTGLGQSYDCPNPSEVTMKVIGKMKHYETTKKKKTQQSVNRVHISCFIQYVVATHLYLR